MATIHFAESDSASEFKKTLAFFARKDYEPDHVDRSSVSYLP